MARRRRRWGFRIGLVAVIALILGWLGWGLLALEGGDEPAGEPDLAAQPDPSLPPEESAREPETDPEAATPANQPPEKTVPPEEIGVGDEGRGAAGDEAVVGAGVGETGSGAAEKTDADAGDAVGDADAGIGEVESGAAAADAETADRLFALLELIREAVATDRLGDGFRALEDLELIMRAEGPPALRAEGRQALGNALTATVLQLRQHLNAGRVLEARRLLRALRGTHHPRVLQALDSMAGGEGWPALGQGPEGDPDVPEPKPLIGERRVLVEVEERLVSGRVAECRFDRVTVRLQRENGVVFPEVARVLVQPVDATGEEAVHQGFAALRAGDRDLAWLWLCRAYAAGGSGELVRQLGRLIGG